MTEIEKVKKGLDLCLTGESFACKDCPYYAECKEAVGIGPSPLRRDALKLLKDPDRIKAVRCKDCRYFEPSNAEEGDNSGYCRNDYAPCQNQTVDAWWFCGSGRKA